MMRACSAATQSSDEYSCNSPNYFYPRQQPQRSLTWKGKGRRYKGTSILPPTPLLPPYPQTGGYSHCRCLKPSHRSKPLLPWTGTPQRPPGEAPIPQAGSEPNHSTRVARAHGPAQQVFIPAPSLRLQALRQNVLQELSTEEMRLCPPLLMQRFWPIIIKSPEASSTLLSASSATLELAPHLSQTQTKARQDVGPGP